MREELLDAVKELSDSYSSKLFDRYRNGTPASEEEKTAFETIDHTIKDKNASAAENYDFILSNNVESELPHVLFAPGCTAGIYINYHGEAMNNVIHSHDFFEIIYVCRGNIGDWVDGVDISLRQGELCIHNPNARHKITKMAENEDFVLNILLPRDIFHRSFYEMLFEDRELDQFFNSFMLSPDGSINFMVFRDTPAAVDTIIELIVEEFLRGENASRFIFEATFVVLFGELLRNYKSNDFSRRLVSYITGHITDISIKETATYFGYHKNYFTSVVKAECGYKFNELLTKIRLQKALSMMLFTDNSLEEISSQIGYKSTASFYCHFKETYKMTPDQYRKLHT